MYSLPRLYAGSEARDTFALSFWTPGRCSVCPPTVQQHAVEHRPVGRQCRPLWVTAMTLSSVTIDKHDKSREIGTSAKIIF